MDNKTMLYVGPWDSRPKDSAFVSWSRYFVNAFARSGWQVTLFPYREVYNREPILNFSRGRIQRVAQWFLRRSFFDKCLKHKPAVIFLEKAEKIAPCWLLQIKQVLPSPLIVFFNPDDPQSFSSLGISLGSVADLVLSSSALCVPMYRDLGVHWVHYVPFWAIPGELSIKTPVPEAFQTDVAFVGSYYPERGIVLQALVGQGFNLKIWGHGWENAPTEVRKLFWTGHAITNDIDLRNAYRGCKIALNIHHVWMKYGGMKSNVRTYEAMANGAFVLSDRTLGIDDLFRVGEELECYDSIDDLKVKIKYYLHHPTERERIAMLGYRAVKDRYTIESWVERVNDFIFQALEQSQR